MLPVRAAAGAQVTRPAHYALTSKASQIKASRIGW